MFMRYFCIIIPFICKCVRARILQKLIYNKCFIDLCNKNAIFLNNLFQNIWNYDK